MQSNSTRIKSYAISLSFMLRVPLLHLFKNLISAHGSIKRAGLWMPNKFPRMRANLRFYGNFLNTIFFRNLSKVGEGLNKFNNSPIEFSSIRWHSTFGATEFKTKSNLKQYFQRIKKIEVKKVSGKLVKFLVNTNFDGLH